MQYLAIGLWGCFFGAAVVMLAGAAVAYAQSLYKIAVNASVAALSSAFYVAAFLGLISFGDPSVQRSLLGWIAVGFQWC